MSIFVRMDPQLKRIFEKQHYAFAGEHSAVKLCHWMRQSLLYGRTCYKQLFYGIQSHRCLQMTPTITQCTHMCLFCWRYQQFTNQEFEVLDDPVEMLDNAIAAQQKLITGFKGDERCDQKKWKEANKPNMVACSLSGEPTLYPKLGAFFEECHKRNMTTFLVTNGTQPEALAALDPLPTQLYVSVIAPDKQTYKRLCLPLIPDGWDRIMNTLELLPSLDTRIVIRHTLLEGWNMDDKATDQFAKLDAIADPLCIEPKGYVFVGYSRNRLTLDQMPSHAHVQEFGHNLADRMGYTMPLEQPESRVVLLTSTPEKVRLPSKKSYA